jgi:nuclear transport factor 2 (NTF2) superfamily protein
MTAERLAAFLQAWNDRDADAVMTYFTEDCLYHNSVGPEFLGETYRGQDGVRAALLRVYETYSDARWVDADIWVGENGDRGAAEWTIVYTRDDGEEIRIRGCDLFEFAGDRICVKNAFRKVQPPQ